MQILHSLKNIKISKLLRGKISHVLKQQVGRVTSLTRVMLTDPPFNFDKICLFGDQIPTERTWIWLRDRRYMYLQSQPINTRSCVSASTGSLCKWFFQAKPLCLHSIVMKPFPMKNETHESDLQTNNNGCFSVTSNEPTRDPRDTGLSESAMDIEDLASFSGAMLGPRVMYMIMQ